MTATSKTLVAALVGLLVAGAACTGDSTSTDDTDGPSRSGTAAPGVTDDSIKVGVVLLDLEAAAPLGLGLDNFELETQEAAFEALFDAINADGGIAGRTIEPVYVVNDPLDADISRAGCLELTEDEGVFAVLGYVTGAVECITVEHETPLIFHTNDLDARYRESGNRLIGPLPSLERTASSWAVVMEQTIAEGTVAIVAADDGSTQQLAADSLQMTIENLGHTVAHRIRVTEATSASAIELEVPKMRSAGVDTVFLATDFATAAQFVRIAEAQGFTPQYLTSEIGTLSADGLVRRMPASFDGALGVTSGHGGTVAARSGEPAPAESAQCIDKHNDATGSEVEWGDEHPVLIVCMIVQIFEAAASAAGDDLTQAAFAESVQQLGEIQLPGRYGGSFAPGKTDYADVFRVLRWSIDCTCYEAAGDPVAVG